MKRFLSLFFTALLGFSSLAHAHKASDAYLFVNADQEKLSVRFDVALRDLDAVVPIDADNDRKITWGEVKAQDAAIRALYEKHLQTARSGEECKLEWQPFMLEKRADGVYLVAQSNAPCGRAGDPASVTYTMLADVDVTHRMIASATLASASQTIIIDPGKAVPTLLGTMTSSQAFASFVAGGIHHIFIGYDHISFILTLILPFALALAGAFRKSLWSVVGIVTAFTIAHSITLTLAALDIVRLPSVWVEVAIAATIVIAALNNLKKFIPGPTAFLGFGFGLIHGFGFAEALREAALPTTAFIWALAGFNIGVEIGQIAIVSLAAIVLAAVSKFTPRAVPFVANGTSIAIALLATYWFWQRWPA
jgi:HupE / UreJ protein